MEIPNSKVESPIKSPNSGTLGFGLLHLGREASDSQTVTWNF